MSGNNTIPGYRKILGVDFDGTLFKHAWPSIGDEVPHAFQILREVQKNSHIVIITMREEKFLEKAARQIEGRGIIPEGYNSNTLPMFSHSRKIFCTHYIGDECIGTPLIYDPVGTEEKIRPYVNWKELIPDLVRLEYLPIGYTLD